MALLSHLIKRVFSHNRGRSHASKKYQQPAASSSPKAQKPASEPAPKIIEGLVIPFVLEDVTQPFVGDIKQLESLAHVNTALVTLGERIEAGTFGEVWKGVWKHAEAEIKVAIKFFVPKYDTAKQERKILHHLQWKNTNGSSDCVVKLIGSGSYGSQEFVVLEFIEGECMDAICFNGDFQSDMEYTKEVFLNLALAIQSLHQRKVIHRDIKAENVIVCSDSRTVKLIDFGCSLLFNDKPFPAGTSPYVAPEVWKAIRTSSDDITIQESGTDVEKSDMFSFGILLWTCLAGKLPFADQSLEQVKKQVMSGQKPRMSTAWPEEIIDVLQMCLKTNPCDRIDSTQLVHLMRLAQ